MKVVFTKAPKAFRKVLKIGTFMGHSRKFDLAKANQMVIDIAKNLSTDQEVDFDFSLLEDNNKQIGNVHDAKITANDGATGLISVLDNVANEQGNSEDSLKVLNLVTDALNENKDDSEAKVVEGEIVTPYDPEDENKDDSTDDSDKDDDSSEDDPNYFDPYGNAQKEEKQNENESSSVGASPDGSNNDDESEITAPSTEIESDNSSKEAVEEPSQQSENHHYDTSKIDIEAFQQESEKQFSPASTETEEKEDNNNEVEEVSPVIPETNKNEVIGMGDYLNTDKVFRNTTEFSEKKFDLTKTLDSLGYVENPKDKYERKLNAAILKALDDLDLSDCKESFLTTKEKLKQEVDTLLDESYSKIQDVPVAQEVESQTNDVIQQLKENAAQDKSDYEKQLNTKVEHRKSEYDNEVSDRVEDFRRNLTSQYQNKLDEYRKAQELDLKSYNKARDEKLNEDIGEVKETATQDIIFQRNSDLRIRKQEITKNFYQKLSDSFSLQLQKFNLAIKKLRVAVDKATKAIDSEKLADEAENRKRLQEEENRRELKRQNDLKERELAIRERNAEEQRKIHQQELELKKHKYDEAEKSRIAREEKDLQLRKEKLALDQKRQAELPEAILKAIEKSIGITAKSQQKIFEAQAKAMGLRNVQESRAVNTPVSSTEDTNTTTSTEKAQALFPSDKDLTLSKDQENQNENVSQKDDTPEDSDDSSVDEGSSAEQEVPFYPLVKPAGSRDITPESDLEENKKKHGKGKKVATALICTLVLLGAGAGVINYVEQNQSVKQQAPAQRNTKNTNKTSVNKSAAATKTSRKQVKSVTGKKKKTVKNSKAKRTKVKRSKEDQDTLNNLKNYQAATTWQQKVDVLNGMLGQHDDRALKEVNNSEPTKLSRLYEAITLQDYASVRAIWLSMTRQEHQDLSRPAINSTAIAFYNVADWEHGWEVRNGL